MKGEADQINSNEVISIYQEAKKAGTPGEISETSREAYLSRSGG
jgi:hypothetical protein